MATPVAQETHRAALRARLERTAASARALADGLREPQRRWTPAGGWSMDQVLEHLCIADEAYLVRMRVLVARPDAPRATPRTAWRPSLAGGLLARSLATTRRLPAPPAWKPLAPRPAVLDAWLAREAEVLQLLERSAVLDWRRVRTSSPISRLIPLNLGDCFTLLAVHGERHLRQMERLTTRPDFPR